MGKIGRLTFLAALLFCWSASAQAVEVDASVDREQVELGRTFTYSVIVKSTETVRLQDPQLPQLTEMYVEGSSVGSETRSQITTTPQGPRMQVQQIQRYNYRISAHALGRQVIAPSQIVVNGQALSTPSVSIEVVPQGTLGEPDPPSGGMASPSPFDNFDDVFNQLLRRNQNRLRQLPMRGSDFFIGVVADKEAVYVGEKLTVTYYLYTNGQVTDIDTLTYPALEGFWKEDIQVATHLNFESVEVRGEFYNRALLASYALFPLRDGLLELDSYQAKVGLLGRGGKVTNTRQSEVKKIFVQALPSPAPENFLGVTGEFQVKGELADRHIRQGQPFEYQIRFDGSGNSKAIKAPELDLPQELSVYSVDSEAQFFRNGNSYKAFKYLIVPAEPGQFTLPGQEAFYFDPESKTYEALRVPPQEFQVLPSQVGPTVPSQALTPKEAGSSGAAAGEEPGWQPTLLATNPGWGLPAPPAALWWGLYILSFVALGVRGHRALGLGQKRRSLQGLVQRRAREIKKLGEREDFRQVGARVSGTTSFLLGEMSGVGGGGEPLEDLLAKTPPSVQRQMGAELKHIMERSEVLSFAPEGSLGDRKERDSLLQFVKRVEKAWSKCLELGFQSEDLRPKS